MLSPNVTGGLFWHWQAWRSAALWMPTVEALEVWLKQQTKETRSDALVIIGASAGWMMPIGWLCQFKEVHTFDIDPLAAPLFRWRHGKKLRRNGTALTCHTQNALSDLPSLLRDYPHACIFFDNVLGQLRFTKPGVESAEKSISQLVKCLKGREWGSLHDRMSGPTTHDVAHIEDVPVRRADWNDQHWLTQLNAQSPWLDHLTQAVFPTGVGVQDFAWNFSPSYRHWLQAGWVRP